MTWALLLCLLWSSPAFARVAEIPGQDALEEIIVSSRKTAEKLQTIPSAMTVLNSREMIRRNMTDIADLGAYIPNTTISFTTGKGGSNDAMIYIRGVGHQDFLFTADPGVGLYVDGVYMPRTIGGVFDLLDLAQVEVLRGPQGTLFGKNAIGGAISLTSRKPGGAFGGEMRGTVGSFNRVDVRGIVDVPLQQDVLSARIALSSKNRDGYGVRRDPASGAITSREGNENADSARLSLYWQPQEDLDITLTGDYNRERENVNSRTLEYFDPTPPLVGLWNALVGGPAGTPITTDYVTGLPYENFSTGPNNNNLDIWGLGLTVKKQFGERLTLNSITAYREMDARFGRDGDNTPLSFISTENTQTQSQLSQEVQLTGSAAEGRLHWLAGLFYFHEKGTDENAVFLVSGLYDALEALPGTLNGSPLSAPTAPGGPGNPINIGLDLDFDIYNAIDIKSYAGFGHISYDLTDRLNLALGARYSYEEKAYTLEHLRVKSGAAIVPLTTVTADWGSFSPQATLAYQWTADLMSYASISHGFKSGGFNGRPLTSAAVESFAPETVLAYETGFKSQWLDDRLRLNLAAFYNDYTDMQLGSISADDNGNLLLIIQNGGTAKITGFEAELQALITPALSLNASVGHTDFNFKKLNSGVQDITLETRQPHAPSWTTHMEILYRLAISDDRALELSGNWGYSSDLFRDVSNTPQLHQDGYSLFNGRITYAAEDNHWRLSVFGTNLSNTRYIVAGLSSVASFGVIEAVYGRPREWGVELAVDF